MRLSRLIGIFWIVLLVLMPYRAQAADFYKVNNGASVKINEFSTCKKVTNNHASGYAIFVPTKTTGEWSAFRSNPPSGVSVANCCPSGWYMESTLDCCPGSGWEYVNSGGGICYKASATTRTWTDARTYCQGLDTDVDLAVIKNGTMQSAAYSLISAQAWISVNDRSTEGTYKNADGDTQTYFNWASGEPSGGGGAEDCVEMYSTGKWNDTTCSASIQGAICSVWAK